MGIVLNWNSTYPGGGIDDTTINFPPVSDGIHDVLATHVNAVANAVIQLETAVGTLGGLGIREIDSSPNLRPIHTLVFPNGSLTDLGSNTAQVSFSTAASGISYNNGTSGLAATDVQDALDEIVALTPGGPGLNFRPVAADFDTPYMGSGNVAVVIADVAGGSGGYTGLPRNFLSFEFTDPDPNTVCVIPMILPSILPDRFKLNLGLFVGTPPPDDITCGISFTNAGATKSIGLNSFFKAVPTDPWGPAISGGNMGVSSVSWELPTEEYGNGIDTTLLFESVQPFAAPAPQLTMEYSVRGLSIPPSIYRQEKFYSFLPSTGDITTDFGGETLKEVILYFAFGGTGFVGTVTFGCWIDIQRHPEDNI